MSNLNVSNRSQSLSSIQPMTKVAAPQAPSQAVPATAPKTSAAPPSVAPAQPAAQETEQQIQKQSSKELRRQSKLVNREVAAEMMSDAPKKSKSSSEGLSPIEHTERAMGQLRSRLRPQKTDAPIDKKGNLTKEANALDILLMRYNPHATKAAKKESDMLRAFAGIEFSPENPAFLDATIEMSKMQPNNPDFDNHLEHVFKTYVQARASQEINVSSHTRGQTQEKYSDFKKKQDSYEKNKTPEHAAELYQARAELIKAMTKNVEEISDVMKDTFSRYQVSSFREDVAAGPDSLINLNHLRRGDAIRAAAAKKAAAEDKVTADKAAAEGKVIDKTDLKKLQDSRNQEVQKAIKNRNLEKSKNGRLYQEYMNNLKDPGWSERNKSVKNRRERIIKQQEQASGAKRSSIKFGLYTTFIAPWKRWG